MPPRRRSCLRACSVTVIFVALVCAILAVCPMSVLANTLELEYQFERPSVVPVQIDGQAYDRVFQPDAPNSGSIGHPALPARGARILLPYGTDVEHIEVLTGERIAVGSGYMIEPVDRPIPLSTSPGEIPSLERDIDIFSLDHPIPENRFVNVTTQTCRGYQILILRLNPTEYIPTTGELFYYSDLTVKVTTSESGSPASGLRPVPADVEEVSSWVDNPSELSTYAITARAGAAAYDMMIITLATLESAFQPLKDYHDTTGVLTEIHTLTDIGANDPHSVRDYIRQEYLTNGIQYVLIGADDNIIPALDMYVISFDRPDAPIEYQLPGDFYFSCLDGTFNYDGDAFYAEPGDGEGGGEVDMFPEVHVGRVAADSPQEVTNLVNKTLAYGASEAPYLEKIFLAGEQLGFGGLGEYGGYAMDEMVDGSDAHGFTTYGYPSDVYEFDKLYDVTTMPSNYWPPSELIARINAGVHVVDHLGHSGPGYAMRTDTAMIRQQLTNTEYCFAYAEGCSAGRFDDTDCWAEYMTVKLAAGAFGCVANARLGLGARSTAHPVHVMDREFWDAVYDANEAKPQIGRAMSDARADHVYNVDGPGMRWTIYETTLFGDPAVAIKSVRSLAITFPDGLPDHVSPDSEVTFSVLVNGIGEGVPVGGSGQLYYKIDSASTVSVPMTELSPNLYEAALPVVNCGSVILFRVSADEVVNGTYYDVSLDSIHWLMPVSDELVVFEDDFETFNGWAITGGLWDRGIPEGLGGEELQYPVPDPTEGCNGPNVMGYNLAGDYENNLPEMSLISPAIDCSGMANTRLRFCRWLGVERPVYDHARVFVSANGVDWTMVWENYATIGDLEWVDVEYDISHVADNQPEVYLRWTMGPTDGGLALCGWNVDNVQVVSLGCDNTVCTVDSDVDGFGDPGHPENECADDNCPYVYNPAQEDVDADGWGDLCDNCIDVPNPEQEDINSNEIGDACEGCCGFWTIGVTGNANCGDDGLLTLSDITRLIDRVYISKAPLCCEANGNTNADAECKITLSDVTVLIDAVYISKANPEGCLPECEL